MPRTRIRCPPVSPTGNIPLPPVTGCGGGGGACGDADADVDARADAHHHLPPEVEELGLAQGSQAASHMRSSPVQIAKNKEDVEAAAVAVAAAMLAPPSRLSSALKHTMLLMCMQF